MESDEMLARLVSVFAQVVDDAPFGIAVFDDNLRFVYVNHHLAGIHGIAQDEHVGHTLGELFPRAHVDPVEPPIRQVLRTGEVHRDVEVTFDVDGRDKTFLISRYPLRPAPGSPVNGVAVVVHDLTDQRLLADLEKRRVHAAYDDLVRLAHALLPAPRQSTPGLHVAAAYHPANTAAAIGGDFFDCFVLPGGRGTALVIGDVAGHDTAAATEMAQVKAAVRAYAFEDPHPGRVMARTNSLLYAFDEFTMTSLVYALYQPQQRTLAFANAGHPPPLLIRSNRVTVLDEEHGVILGAARTAVVGSWPIGHVPLEPEDVVLLYTDGLIERRHIPIDTSIALLADLLSRTDLPSDPAALLTRVLTHQNHGHLADDDICLLAMRVTLMS